MESAKYHFLASISSVGLRITFIITLVTLTVLFLITQTAIEAHSESDVKYRQESIFLGAGLGASKGEIILLEATDEKNKVIAMSYEVDQVTPTPTPKIDPNTDDVWLKLADCESHKNWSSDTGNGYYGGLQFSMGAWASVGGQGKPSEASSEEQIAKGKLLQSRRGWGPWGGCSKKLGLL